jgi:hypothetical protein
VGTETENRVLAVHGGHQTLTYLCFVVGWHRARTSRNITLFTHIQRITCLSMTGCMKSTPTAALEVLLGLPALQEVAKKEALNAACRLHHSGQFRGPRVGHSAILKELASIGPIILAPTDTMLNVKVFDRKFQILIPSRSD